MRPEYHHIRTEKMTLHIQSRYVAQPEPRIQVPPTPGEDTCRRVPEQVQLMQHSPYELGNGIHVDLQSGEYSIPSVLLGLIKDLTRPIPPGLKVKLLSPKATWPQWALLAQQDMIFLLPMMFSYPPRGRVLIPTGLAMAIREGWYGKPDCRSGLAWKAELGVKAGWIDKDNRGHAHVVLKNDTHRSYQVTQWEKIEQLLLQPYCNGAVEQVETVGETARGDPDFSSTGSRALEHAYEKSTPPQTDKDAIENLRVLRIEACRAGHIICVQGERAWEDMTNGFNASVSEVFILSSPVVNQFQLLH